MFSYCDNISEREDVQMVRVQVCGKLGLEPVSVREELLLVVKELFTGLHSVFDILSWSEDTVSKGQTKVNGMD